MRLEKGGVVLSLEGTWMEISNRYGVQEYGDVAVNEGDVPADFGEKRLERFIREHSVCEKETPARIKRVALDPKKRILIQIQAVKASGEDYWVIQEYDNQLVFMRENLTVCCYRQDVLEQIRKKYDIQSCLRAEVYRDSLGDCTNSGISATRDSLYILGCNGPLEAGDLRECVKIERRELLGSEYLSAKPVYFPDRWYMAGGNFLYTSDSRFREYTGSNYPVPIHDRYEGGMN